MAIPMGALIEDVTKEWPGVDYAKARLIAADRSATIGGERTAMFSGLEEKERKCGIGFSPF